MKKLLEKLSSLGDDPDGPGLERYHLVRKPKASGGVRVLHVPDKRLMKLQRELVPLLRAVFPPHEIATGFAPGCGPLVNARRHFDAVAVGAFDVVDFFGSHELVRMFGSWAPLPGLQRRALILHTTCQGPDGYFQFPQGAPTSPVLADLACLFSGLDDALVNAAARPGLVVTRFADDVTISARPPAGLGDVERALDAAIVEVEKRKLAVHKRRVQAAPPFAITGLMLDAHGINAPEAAWEQLEEAVLDYRRTGAEKDRAIAMGYIGYLAQLDEERTVHYHELLALVEGK